MDWNKPANSLKCKSWLKVVESSDQMIPFSFIETDSVPVFVNRVLWNLTNFIQIDFGACLDIFIPYQFNCIRVWLFNFVQRVRVKFSINEKKELISWFWFWGLTCKEIERGSGTRELAGSGSLNTPKCHPAVQVKDFFLFN